MTESTITTLSFEDGYERLQQIAARLNEEDVPVSELCDLFEQGKGLEQALIAYLDTQKARVEAIQNGQGIRAFAITEGNKPTAVPVSTAVSVSSDSQSSGALDATELLPTAVTSAVADDAIPF